MTSHIGIIYLDAEPKAECNRWWILQTGRVGRGKETMILPSCIHVEPHRFPRCSTRMCPSLQKNRNISRNGYEWSFFPEIRKIVLQQTQKLWIRLCPQATRQAMPGHASRVRIRLWKDPEELWGNPHAAKLGPTYEFIIHDILQPPWTTVVRCIH